MKMSFQDLEVGSRFQAPNRFTGGRQQQRPSSRGDPSQEVATGIFRISTAVNSFFRLVNSIGTPKDTLELREKLLVAIFNHTLLLFFAKSRSSLGFWFHLSIFIRLDRVF